ncbi:Hydantoinase/oxoprolinase N-terminal region-domain-containing protein [Coniochaeta sp. 2T2.1]|nr:Hydantoinase/oxoprolinase N-terminal region-domain-containing protein [Coniochaeta sp. 2T2.1]
MAITTNIPEAFPYRIGVDVGGTNTDAVIVDTTVRDRTKSIIAAQKSPTTQPSVTDGIEAAVRSVLQRSGIDRQRVASLPIGSTHFINAIAVIRLSKSFTREVPPFSDFPSELTDIMRGHCTQIDGGLQIDGSLEAPVVESQVLRECARIKGLGLKAVVVSGVFSPLDHHYHQEQTVRVMIERELPDVTIVYSSEISNIGFLERENASILNASIHHFAKRTIREFKTAMKRLGLQCSLYLTQNDGTLLDAVTAARLPIRALSSGTTNSIRGGAYLCGLYDGNASPTSIVCDIGGTTTDVNYGMSQVESIGIGGGSIIRSREGQVTVGRDSVGYEIRKRALVFGGDTMTATDVAVAQGVEAPIGDAALVRSIDRDTISEAQQFIKREYERVCDLMKSAPEPLPLILVGGGSIICPQKLDGISRIICPPHHDVANAVGAAMARISATVDIVQNISSQTISEAMLKAASMAIEKVAGSTNRNLGVSINVDEYRPIIVSDEQSGTKTWIVSPTDLEWMADGCYVLGCGGGGSPYPEMLKLQQHIPAGNELKIVDMSSLRKDASIYCRTSSPHCGEYF